MADLREFAATWEFGNEPRLPRYASKPGLRRHHWQMFCHGVPPLGHPPWHAVDVAFVLQHAVAVTV
jgi:hypothetical protein